MSSGQCRRTGKSCSLKDVEPLVVTSGLERSNLIDLGYDHLIQY